MRQVIKQNVVNILERQLFVVLAVASAFVVRVDAANTVTYDMNGSGGWGDTTRWVGGTVPVEGDTVVIPAGRVVVNDSDYSVYSKVKINMTSGESVLSIAMEEATHRNPFPLCQHLSV